MSINVTTVEAEAKGFFHTAVSRAAVLLGEVGAFIKHAILVLKGDIIVHVIVPIENRLGSLKVTTTVESPAPAVVAPEVPVVAPVVTSVTPIS